MYIFGIMIIVFTYYWRIQSYNSFEHFKLEVYLTDTGLQCTILRHLYLHEFL